MININIKESEKELEVVIEGHAGYAETGKDIICASVSALFYTMLNFFEDRKTTELTEYIIKNDLSIYRVKHKSKYFSEVFPIIAAGFEMIRNDYPGYVNVNIERAS
jgi:uncharacterized protein YsxB (DUF464 family)